jgi:DNA-binding NarL/FixJ family response regulator
VIRVVVADDQELVRQGFARLLRDVADIEVVGEAEDGASAVTRAVETQPDVVLMDVRMPGMDGVEATARIVRGTPSVRVLMLTTFDLDESVHRALEAGASGFLLKDTPYDQLIHAIRAVSRGDAVLAPSVTRRLIDTFTPQPDPTGSDATRLGRLTDRELEVLRLVADGMSNAEIGQELFLSEPTVKTHVGRLLTKLGCRDRVQATVFAFRSGFVPRS